MIHALVIDDNRYTADSLCQLLSLLDIDARAAYGPRAAMIELSNKVPDVVLLDLNMPGVTGFEVLGYLRREPRLLNIPVVVVTAEDQRHELQRAVTEGAVAVIIKPATIDDLEAVLRKAGVVK
jgi:CheY-like chemotaxis protein